MPLQKGSSEQVISNNIKELIDAGHSPAQAEAIAYSNAGKDEKESKRELDLNGWTIIRDNPISKVGVFEYSGAQISSDLDPDKIYKVYRSEEELSKEECIESFKLVPWIDEHVMLGDSEDGLTPAEEKGIEGIIGEEVYFKDGYLLGNLKVFSKNMSNLIKDGKIELSIGYRCEYDIQSGSFNGVHYDAVQKNIRGNHIALVEEGRSGPDVAVLDHFKFTFDAAELKMSEVDKETKDQEIAKDEGEMSLSEIVSLAGKLNAAIEKMKSSGVVDEDTEVSDQEAEKKAEDEDEKKEDAKDEEEDKEKKAEDEDDDDKKETKDEDQKSSAMDSKIKSLEKRLAMMEKNTVNISEVSKKNELAEKLSNVIGVFDHKDKSLDAVARYGVKKLGINCKSGHECAALDGYFAAQSASTTKYGLDARVTSSVRIDKYFKAKGEQV
jgi:uncharacterized protein